MDADKRVALDSEKPSEGVPTSLRFSSQPSSFSPGTYGNDNSITTIGIKDRSFQEKRELFESSLASQKQDSSPIKISPVSERIKALEALAAKQNDSDWSDTGFHFRERHYEKSHSEIHGINLRSSIKKKPTSSEQDSPESPFEILGDSRRGSDFEDTADWMRAHLPPAPNFNIAESDFDEIKESSVMPECPPDETKSKDADVQGIPSSFVGVPDEFMDIPDEMSKQTDDDDLNQSKQDTVEDKSEFDLRFLPTAYMWDKQDKPDVDTQEPPFLSETQDSEITSPAAPPESFEAPPLESLPPVPQADSNAKQQLATLVVETHEADSSGESDDTVIEEASGVGNDAIRCGISPDKQIIPNEQEKRGLQVPVINVIETEEQVPLSDYEVEPDEEEDDEQRYQIMQETATEASKPSEELSEISRSEFEETAPIMDDLFSLENLADSDGEYSPKHKIISDVSQDTSNQTFLPSKSHDMEDPQTQSTVPQNTDETSRESSFNNVKSDETTEIVPDLPPSYEDLTNDFESSDIDTYLDHYASEELALKDQLNSGVFAVNNGDTNELLKSDPLQQSQNNTVLAQQPYEETVDDFDVTIDESKQNYDTEPFPANISVDVPVEPLSSQNNMPHLELDNQSVEIEDKKTKSDSGNFSLIEEDITRHEEELPSFQQNTLAQFPSFHDDPSSNIIDVIAEFVTSDVTEGPPMSNTEPDEISQFDDPHKPISPEPKSKPDAIEAESKQNEIVQRNVPDIQISEEPANVSDLIDTEFEQDEIIQCNAPDSQISSETPSKPESTESESSPTDSFVEFMRECLKSQQDEESQSLGAVQTAKEPVSDASPSPAMIMDMEQECLTICALKELGSSPDQQDVISIPKDIPISAKEVLSQPLYQSESLIFSNPSPRSLPNENQPDASLTKEIEALNIWVAEAYHLAEHVLALILTHLTGKVLPLGCQPANPALKERPNTKQTLLTSLNSFAPTTLCTLACF